MENLTDEINEYNYNDAIAKLKNAVEYLLNPEKEQDFRKFLILCKLSAFQGNYKAQYILGLLYGYGLQSLEYYFDTEIVNPNIVIEKNYTEALEWFERSANNGYEPAQFEAGYFYYSGDFIDIDYEKALKYFKMSQNKDSCFYLGIMYESGLGVKPDIDIALRWYMESSRLGNPLGYLYLGNLYKREDTIEDNY